MSPAEPSRLLPAANATLRVPKRLTRSPPEPSKLLSDEKAIELGA